MATGIIGTISGAATLTYSAKNNGKLSISYSAGGTGSVAVNGSPLFNGANYATIILYIGAGQTITIVGTGSANAIVSVLEST